MASTIVEAPSRLLTCGELALTLHVSESQVYALAAGGVIPSIRVGRRAIRFRLADVMAALENQERTHV